MPSYMPCISALCIGIVLLGGCANPSIRQAADPAPELRLAQVLQAPEEVEINWEALKGKIVVLEFWATWCAPCLVALEHHNELADQFEGQPVQFIAITDEEESVIRDYLKRRRIAGWVGLDPDRVMFDAFGIRGIPATVLVDRQGIVRAVTHPHELNEQVLKDVLADRPVELAAYITADMRGDAPRPPRIEQSPPVVQITIRDSKRPQQGSAHGPGFFLASGWTVGHAIAHAFDTQNIRMVAFVPRTRVEGDPLVRDRKIDFEVRVPPEQEALIQPLLREALKAVCNYRVDRRETEVYVLQATAEGPTENLQPGFPDKGFGARSRPGLLAGVNGPLWILTSEIEDLLGLPVVNETNLSGKYYWEVKYDAHRPESVIEAVGEQLGLELIRTKREVEFYVVEELNTQDRS